MAEQIDWLVLTAANRAQARGYEAQLRDRQDRGLLPHVRRWKVVADPGGRRVGSGGSTLWVLHELARDELKRRKTAGSLAALFEGLRVLVIHSGGDSRRLCAYAGQGKVFTPLPCPIPPLTASRGRVESAVAAGDDRSDAAGIRPEDGGAQPGESSFEPATLFDLIARDLVHLDWPDEGRVLLASGDVLLTFYHREVDLHRPGVVGVAYPATLQRGSKHGVYVADGEAVVVDFLQKPNSREAADRGAVDGVGRVLVDTGLVAIDPSTCQRWLDAAGVAMSASKSAKSGRGDVRIDAGIMQDLLEGDCPPIDLYEQMLMALPARRTRKDYLTAMGVGEVAAGDERQAAHLQRLVRLHEALHRQPFHVNVLPYCEFFHIGTTRELLSNIGGLSRTAQIYHFRNFAHASAPQGASLEGAFLYNSLIESKRMYAAEGTLLEACAADAQTTVNLPGRNVVVGWPAKASRAMQLPEGWGLVCLPVGRDGWAAVVFGVDDDFKTRIEKDGTFGNAPMHECIGALTGEGSTETAAKRLWKRGAARTLWDAKLWRIGPIDVVLDDAMMMIDVARAGTAGKRHASNLVAWREARRMSMGELIRKVDHKRLIAHRRDVQRRVRIHKLDELLEMDPWTPAGDVLSWVHNAEEAATALERMQRYLQRTDSVLRRASAYKLEQLLRHAHAKTLDRGGEAATAERTAFECIARAVEQTITRADAPAPAAILPDQVIWATTPVRLDFMGGWSDTPPICTEMGGAVVNAAITLNGQYPVQVMAKLNPEHRAVTIHSIDLGRHLTVTNTRDMLAYTDPSDWAALPKAALVLAGLAPADERQSLKRWLEVLGGGVDLTCFSALPKGSGLGTSSVLGSALLACLSRIRGETVPQEALFTRTSLLEQMMTTGGGWQDQVGGVTPGVKISRTVPGVEQLPSIHWTGLDLSPNSPAAERLLLYFTGQKRMAKNILQNVVGRYLARDREVIAIIHALKDAAERMKDDLDRGDVDALGRGIDQYWSLKKRIDPGSTNDRIEPILKLVEPYVTGKVLPGAGGGGFVFMVARDAKAAATIRRKLTANPPNPLARFFEFQVDPVGLNVTVL